MAYYAEKDEVGNYEQKVDLFAHDVKLYGRWSLTDVRVDDESLNSALPIIPKWSPHTSGRYQKKRFRKINCPVVERLMNAMMMHGRNSGKKLKAYNIMRQALEFIELENPLAEKVDLTGEDRYSNPVQVLITALELGGAREDSTRVGSAGVVRRQAVDVAPLRRVSKAIALIVAGARRASFRNQKTMAECLADEICLCAKNSPNSYALKKKNEIERVAESNR